MDSVEYKRPYLWNPDSKSEHQAEYLKRLTQLRASLIGQEESNLEHALSRFRFTSTIGNTSAGLKQREARKGVPRRRRLLSTYEQFKLMRPVKPPVFIFPLEGHQVFEPKVTAPKSSSRGKGTGTKKHVEETVKTNLQRMRNPESGFPNSMRTTLKPNELILDTSNLESYSSMNSPQGHFNDSSRGLRAKSSNSENLTDSLLGNDGEQDYARPNSYAGGSFPSITLPRGRDQRSGFRTNLKVKTRHKSDSSVRADEGRTDYDRKTYVLPRIQPSGLKSSRHSFTNNIMQNNKDKNTKTSQGSEEQAKRKYIRVDMPVIYTCPTPDIDETTDSCDAASHSNTYTQRSFQEELQSLIDDVTELTSRTDSQNHV